MGTIKKKSQRLHRLSSDPPLTETLIVPAHSSGSSNPIIMAINLENQSLKDQFLHWRQDIETKQQEQARHMAKLQSRVDNLQHENDRVQDCLEEDRGDNARGSSHLVPPVK